MINYSINPAGNGKLSPGHKCLRALLDNLRRFNKNKATTRCRRSYQTKTQLNNFIIERETTRSGRFIRNWTKATLTWNSTCKTGYTLNILYFWFRLSVCGSIIPETNLQLKLLVSTYIMLILAEARGRTWYLTAGQWYGEGVLLLC